jgi:hypothetical protein
MKVVEEIAMRYAAASRYQHCETLTMLDVKGRERLTSHETKCLDMVDWA